MLTTDSTAYTVEQRSGWYHARIGYVYHNATDRSVSANYCRTVGPPALEKYEDGEWVLAYSPILLACLSVPPFILLTDSSYSSAVEFAAAPPNQSKVPDLRVDSIPGLYRLRWVLRVGSDPDAKDAPVVEAISNTFRFTVAEP